MSTEEYKQLKEAVGIEGGFRLSDPLLDKFLSFGEQVSIRAKEYVIAPETVDKSIWITIEGVMKACHFDGRMERVMGFSGNGTITLSPMSMVTGQGAWAYFQAVTNCEMMRIPFADFEKLMEESNEFARWMFGVCLRQLCAFEMKGQMLSGSDIASNYKTIVKRQMRIDQDGFGENRPDLLSVVSSKDLASYLGITQSYLSNIRKAIWEEVKKDDEKK